MSRAAAGGALGELGAGRTRRPSRRRPRRASTRRQLLGSREAELAEVDGDDLQSAPERSVEHSGQPTAPAPTTATAAVLETMVTLLHHVDLDPGNKAREDVPDARVQEATDVAVEVDTTTLCALARKVAAAVETDPGAAGGGITVTRCGGELRTRHR